MNFVIYIVILITSIISFSSESYAEPGCVPGTVQRTSWGYSCQAQPRGEKPIGEIPRKVVLVKELPDLDELKDRYGRAMDLGYMTGGYYTYVDGKKVPKKFGTWVGYIGTDTSYRSVCKGDVRRMLEIAKLEKLPPVPAQFADIPFHDMSEGICAGVKPSAVKAGKSDWTNSLTRFEPPSLQKVKVALGLNGISTGWLAVLFSGFSVLVLLALSYLYRAITGNSGRGGVNYSQLYAELDAMPENTTPGQSASLRTGSGNPDVGSIQNGPNGRTPFGLRGN